MEQTEIISIIDRIEDYRMLRFRRDNLLEQRDRLRTQGYDVAANDRDNLLSHTQAELEAVEPDVTEMITRMKQGHALHPKDKALRLIALYIELLDTPPMKMKAVRQKIASLRPQVLGTVDDINKMRDERGLFDNND